MKRSWPIIVIAIGIAAFYYFRYRRAPNIEFNKLEIVSLDGTKTNVGSELGEYSVVHFYASWCGPCLREMKSISENIETFRSLNITPIFITDDTEQQILATSENMPPEIQFYRVNNLSDAGIYTLPTTYILSGNEVLSKHLEALDWGNKQEIEKIIFNR